MSVDAGTGSILCAMASAAVFRLVGTLVGTHAFRLYEDELGEAFELAMNSDPGWQHRIKASLSKLPDVRQRLEMLQ